jgi:NADH-quinone oxidoreductase subunit N
VIALGSLLIQVFGLAGIGQAVFVGLAAITMTVGNLQALGQRNLKRMLGYSSVAQLGTIIVGIAAGTMAGLEAVVFYMIAYALTNIGAFAAIAALKDGGVSEDLEAYRGLAKRTPATALLLTLFLLSLAGVPLLAGFVGKLFVFKSAVDAGLISLALIALVNTVIAYFYYTRVIVRMWLMEADGGSAPVTVHGLAMSALVVAAVGVLVLGLLPGPFLDYISGALDSVKLIGSR